MRFPLPFAVRRGQRISQFAHVVLTAAACALLCGVPSLSRAASSTYQITVQTSGLSTVSQYGLYFILQNGSTTNPLQAQVRNFRLTNGAFNGAGSSSLDSASTTGSLATTLSLATVNGDDFSDFQQNFKSTNGSSAMSFALTLSSAAPEANAFDPDTFSFQILNAQGASIATNASDNISLAYAEFNRTAPLVRTYNAASPTILVLAVAAPEPATLSFLWPALGLCGAAYPAHSLWQRRRNKRFLTD